ncbi:MAG: heavy-metal-associated domain-containing protein [Thermodesulfovibrionales bacterium]|nr:heavy-metal-associated domain-containing protein [Thermodesulfovibrionales bacterium]
MSDKAKIGIETERMRFKAHGITCRDCAADMETVLTQKDGINSATVDYNTDIIDVSFNPGSMDKKDVYKAVRKLGFKVDILKD